MAIYHLNVRGVSPSTGAGPVKKAAYQSGQTLVEERTGEVCDYARKERVLDEGLALPDGSPAVTRQQLWNMAEERWAEDGGGKQLVAKRIEGALPRELSAEEQRQLVSDLCARFTAQGKACDWAIHVDVNGQNPHFHILVSDRPLTADGFEPRPKGAKGQCFYLCWNDKGERLNVPADQWKLAKADGWQKVYNFTDGKRRTLKQAKAEGLTTKDRTSKRPVQMHRDDVDGGKNNVRALDVEKAELKRIRADWTNIANRRITEHNAATGENVNAIDHRSNAARGLDELPTIHEGGAGLIGHAERVARNKEIKARNERLKVLRAELAREQAELEELEREVEQAKRKARTAEGSWQKRPRGGERQRKNAVAKRRRMAMATASAKVQVERRMAKAQTDTADTTSYMAEQLDAQIAALGQQIQELQHAPTPSTANLNKALKLAEERKALIAERKGIKPAQPSIQPLKPEQDRSRGPKH